MRNETRDADYVAFVESTWEHYLRLARLLTGDRHRAEELLQDSLITLYGHWRRVSARGDPHAYLRRMLINGNVSWWRRRRREHLVADVPERTDPRTAEPHQHDDLQQALRRLPPQQRAVVVLRHYEDLSEKTVAATLGCSIGTVKSQNARAMARLRQDLAGRGASSRRGRNAGHPTEEKVYP
jgi:RNA polymerase sigma-70 factor (sigma-E family)